ncbi:MAG: hypothetical protein E5X00_10615 [Mesorhizobium sp.]|nr:MAG: hypothetical protein E5X00_10615 [Mesorhizobium sp.]
MKIANVNLEPAPESWHSEAAPETDVKGAAFGQQQALLLSSSDRKPSQQSRVASHDFVTPGGKMQGLKRSRWTETYDLNEFAAKHGLTTRQAEIVIQSNGPSKRKCDLAAEAFRAALRQCSHSREKGARRSPSKEELQG